MANKILSFSVVVSFMFLFTYCSSEAPSEPVISSISCTISNPLDGSSISRENKVAVTIEITSPFGNSSGVEILLDNAQFLIDGELRLRDSHEPYEYAWDLSQESVGTHSISVIVTDNSGAVCSDTISVTVRSVTDAPLNTGGGWETATLESVGINPTHIVSLMSVLNNHPDHLVHGILIARNGKLVMEEYFDGYRRDDQNTLIHFNRDVLHDLASSTKSFTSALLGLAIEHGFIESVEQHIYDFFPEIEWGVNDPRREITLKHMITMSSGLQWDQHSYPTLDQRNDLMIFATSDTPWQMYLSRPLEEIPGTHINYCGASINVVGECIRRSSGLRLDQFADEYLFEKLGILDRSWNVKSSEWIWASGDLNLRPRDMLKFGQLYLQSGVWDGEQVVSKEWAEGASEPYIIFDIFPSHRQYWASTYDIIGYSYAWWTLDDATYGNNAFTAAGWGDQRIMVLPEHDMVVVFTGGSEWEAPYLTSHQMMFRYILPAIN